MFNKDDGEEEEEEEIPNDVCYTDHYHDVGVFWDWCSIFQKDPTLFDENEVYREDGHVPEYFGGKDYDQSRTAEQKLAFKDALDNTMDLW